MHAQYPTMFEHSLLKMILEEVSLPWAELGPPTITRAAQVRHSVGLVFRRGRLRPV